MQGEDLTQMMAQIKVQSNTNDQIGNVMGSQVGLEEFEENQLLEELETMKI